MENISPAEYEALMNGPALHPPPGVTPNFDHPDTLSVYAVPTVALAISFSTLALAMRIYTQRRIARPLYWEDYTAALAWAMFIGWCAPNLIAARHGGAHQWNTRLRDFFEMLYVCCASIGRLVYIIILFETKDQTRAIIAPGLCGIAEVSLGLICTCLPTIPMFFTVMRSQLPQLSILGFTPFKNSTAIPQLDSASSTFRTTHLNHDSIWHDSVGDKGSARTVHELESWQMTPRTAELLVHISSPGRRKGQDRELEEGKILQTVRVEVEANDIGGRSYYDGS
ncbi:uncharacterized protein BP5553_09650 [Venustampulla echinocandica]|uniref:Rhodopsin domain-containing protein n=1 Tax=Venustampulla echinocandica TaxID=2656787 RepID=A0A370TBK8_9HELO|nr:uncharacterized protein BP5553_09650 [Venustampulla echinocandica]RDL31441.1 hypothetical protein BP5553_09650 [Venustampulla echinocandica]